MLPSAAEVTDVKSRHLRDESHAPSALYSASAWCSAGPVHRRWSD